MAKRKAIPLRERQVQLSRDAILDVSFTLFTENGYSSTTVQEISDMAGVGPATVFRHFKSKLGVLTALIRRDLLDTLSEGDRIVQNLPEDPIDALMDVLVNMLSLLDAPSRTLRTSAFIKRQFDFSSEEVNDLMSEADEKSLAQIAAVFERLRDRGQLSHDLEIRDLAAIIFQIFNHHFYQLTRPKPTPRQEVIDDMRQLVRTVFESWWPAK